jgi:prepilin-type N-terminal cleavage/methylation domain-containing protein
VDDGFTLLETLISIAMISLVTTSLTMFFTQSHAATALQSQNQLANQVASAAMDRVSLLPGTALVAGRPATCVAKQWATPVPEVSTYLSQMTQVADVSLGTVACPTAPNAITALLGTESLPTVNTVLSTVNGAPMTFTQNFYVGLCWQTPTDNSLCRKPAGTMPSTTVPMLRVVIAVTWSSARCPTPTPATVPATPPTCSYVTDTLVTQNLTDLTFQLKTTTP